MTLTATEYPSSRSSDGALYLDNAATSWPKPPGVAQSVLQFMTEIGANPGRSGHRRSVEAVRIVYEAREAIATLFNTPNPLRVIFGLNATDALNQALHGLLRPGDHVITSSMEHNAVMRPLTALENQGVHVTRVACAPNGSLDPSRVEAAINPSTRLIVLTHASNVCGTILPIRAVGQIARKSELLFLVDAAQTGGVIPIDMSVDAIDLLAFTGHKSLYGPMGTGGLVVGERVLPADLRPIRQGGTGSRSDAEVQPDFFPDRYESGTANAAGLAGLRSGISWILQQGVINLRATEQELCACLLDGLASIPRVIVYGSGDPSCQTATVAFNINDVQPSTVGLRLDEEYGVLCRVGLHCAPSAHRTLGTFPGGCVRFGLGAFNTRSDIDYALAAVADLSREIR